MATLAVCSHCLMEWEEAGIDYRDQPVQVSTVVDGNSLCVQHFRARVLQHDQATV